ncbi:MAG: FAD-dependent oxidoreductase [Deltaproteobacteria bacterium]|nr:FAD-dependent oxidoreductase [Deltaproteobacteria bacterium]
MKLKKPKKNIKTHSMPGSGAGGEESNLRPRYVPKTPPCVVGCPQGTDIRGWLQVLAQHEDYEKTSDQAFEEAFHIITDHNPLPSTCGRVCPHPCETECNRKDVDGAVAINVMERFVGDYGLEKGLKLKKLTDEKHDEKVAVIGAGPAGLACAYHLARRGYPVTIFEAFAKAGGMLRYGIPAYRLPRDVLQKEIDNILDLGVELKLNTSVGKDISYDEVKKDYRAVFVGIGAHKGYKLRVPGEDAPNVFTGTEFLNRANSGETVEIGDKVVVVGGGDTAIDAARVARRMGADVTIVYRRTRKEMPAIQPEIEGAEEEGVKIELLTQPIEVLQKDGKAVGIRCQRQKLGEPDASGRARPVPIEGSEFEIQLTSLIPAISQEPDFDPLPDLHEGRDWMKVDDHMKIQNEDGVYGGGDSVNLGLVTIAMAQGRMAADSIEHYLRSEPYPAEPDKPPVVRGERMKLSWYKPLERNSQKEIPVDARFADPDAEIAQGLSTEQALNEAKRCMSCGMCFDCDSCWMFCQNSVFEKLPKGQHYKMKVDLCNGCKKCAEECPCGYIDMV